MLITILSKVPPSMFDELWLHLWLAPNTIINTTLLVMFGKVYISDGFKTGLSTHELNVSQSISR